MYFDVNLLTVVLKKIVLTSNHLIFPVKIQQSNAIYEFSFSNNHNINVFAVYYLTATRKHAFYLLLYQLLKILCLNLPYNKTNCTALKFRRITNNTYKIIIGKMKIKKVITLQFLANEIQNFTIISYTAFISSSVI